MTKICLAAATDYTSESYDIPDEQRYYNSKSYGWEMCFFNFNNYEASEVSDGCTIYRGSRDHFCVISIRKSVLEYFPRTLCCLFYEQKVVT